MGLVEREELLDRLAAAQAEAALGAGRLVVVRGEAGAGKTSVVRAALAGTDARWGWCEPLTVPRPLGPFRDLVAVADQGPLAVGELLLAELRARPTTLVVEDAHWIDDAAADVVRFLGRRIEATRGLLVVTYRDELGPEHPLSRVLGELAVGPALVRLTVPPLSTAAVAELLSESGRDPLEAWRVTRGNAFLVDQLLRSPEPTEAVREAVAARVARLSPSARELVRALSVVPRRVPGAALGDDVDEAVRAGLLEAHGQAVGFRHELVRLAVERDLAPSERRAAHLTALERADRFEPPDEPAVLAFHARGAGLDARAHRLDLQAADRAAGVGAHRQAVAHLRTALADRSPEDDAARSALLLRLAASARAVGDDETAAGAVVEAVALADRTGDPLVRGRALGWLSRVAETDDASRRAAEKAVSVLAPLGVGVPLARALALRATCLMIQRSLTAAVVAGRDAVQTSRAVDDPESLTVALQALGCSRMLLGEDTDGAMLRGAIEVAEAAGLDSEAARARANLVSAAGESRCYALADAAMPDAMAWFAARDLDGWSGYARAWWARCLFETGRWREATQVLDDVLGLGSPSRITTTKSQYVLGRIRARRGDPQVWEALDRAKAAADPGSTLQHSGPVAAARAEARWLAGRTDDGTDGLVTAYSLARERDSPWLLGELMLWMVRHGLRVDGRDVDRTAEPYRLQLSLDHRLAGEAWEAIGCPYEAADAWAHSKDENGVRRALDRAHDLGATPLARIAARRLRELGVRSMPRGPREATAAHPDGLTAREQEVLTWLRGGHTDAEIAAGLHLSVKTVGHHVSAVLHKTGASGRRELRT